MKYDQITEAKKNREQKLEAVKLPYKLGDLSPVLSKNNVDYHYNVLTKAYVRRYNEGEGDPDLIMVEQNFIICFGVSYVNQHHLINQVVQLKN